MITPEHPFEIHLLSVGEYRENCYLLVDGSSREGILVDPGDEAERILEWIGQTRVKQIILTHAHKDHLGAVTPLRVALHVPVGLHPADTGLAAESGITADFDLIDGENLPLGDPKFRIAHIPGHTPGSIALFSGPTAIVGDVIFPGGPGHTNSPQELMQSLDSLRRIVFTWPDDTRLYPGHGPSTTVGAERPGFEALIHRDLPPDLCGDVSWFQ
jgi:hydroxyacylglutathione hydrolase